MLNSLSDEEVRFIDRFAPVSLPNQELIIECYCYMVFDKVKVVPPWKLPVEIFNKLHRIINPHWEGFGGKVFTKTQVSKSSPGTTHLTTYIPRRY